MSVILGFLSFVGRLLLVAIFLLTVIGHMIPHFADVAADMKKVAIPFPEIALVGAIVVLIVGSLCVLMGFHARFGAFLLLVFLGLASAYFHNFWDYPEGSKKALEEMANFMKNASIMGAMVFLIANGAGRFSLDTMRRPAAKTA
jgi:putative oxidoreductase